MELSSKYKRITIYYKQKYIITMSIKSVHLSLWPEQNKTFVEMSVTGDSGLNIIESMLTQHFVVESDSDSEIIYLDTFLHIILK